ncbi:reverse transcriptase domain-containing protein [Tanacetum coccineum]
MTHLLEKETPFIFSKECIEAFETLKMKLTQTPILVAPDWDLPFEIMCDASDFAVGAVLGRKGLYFKDVKTYVWDDPFLFKICADQVIRRCPVHGKEVLDFSKLAHNYPPSGDNHGANLHCQKGLDAGFLWPTIDKVATSSVKKLRPRASVKGKNFTMWMCGLRIDYLSKWVEAKAFPPSSPSGLQFPQSSSDILVDPPCNP